LADLLLHQAVSAVLPGERPVLSPLARLQLRRGRDLVSGLRHTSTRRDQPAMRELLLLLDGNRDVQAVAAELSRRIDAGEVPLPLGVHPDNLLAEVEEAVRDAAARSLLIV
jgi:hypothetical protein